MVFFGIVRLFQKSFFIKGSPIHQYSDTLKSLLLFFSRIYAVDLGRSRLVRRFIGMKRTRVKYSYAESFSCIQIRIRNVICTLQLYFLLLFSAPTIVWGKENYNLFRFFQNLPNLHFLLHFLLNTAFTKEEAEVRKQTFPFVPARYIRTFDVMSEVNCVLLRSKRRFETFALYPSFDVIFEVKCVSSGGVYVFTGGGGRVGSWS